MIPTESGRAVSDIRIASTIWNLEVFSKYLQPGLALYTWAHVPEAIGSVT